MNRNSKHSYSFDGTKNIKTKQCKLQFERRDTFGHVGFDITRSKSGMHRKFSLCYLQDLYLVSIFIRIIVPNFCDVKSIIMYTFHVFNVIRKIGKCAITRFAFKRFNTSMLPLMCL